jgi:hypothetical protein
MAQNTHIRERLGEIMSKSAEEKKWWESRRAMVQADFMKELDDEKKKSSEKDNTGFIPPGFRRRVRLENALRKVSTRRSG